MLYVIGDVHGCYKTLVALLEKINPTSDDVVYFVGDVVHKGRDSAKVLKLIRESHYGIIKGNHEKMLLENFKIGKLHKELIQSYKGREVQLLDDIEFLKQAPYYRLFDLFDQENRQLVITHGYGYNMLGKISFHSSEFESRILKEKIPSDLTPQKASKLDSIYFNVFGHVPLSKPLLAPCMAGIDTGCYNGNYLCAFSFPEKKIILQKSLEH